MTSLFPQLWYGRIQGPDLQKRLVRVRFRVYNLYAFLCVDECVVCVCNSLTVHAVVHVYMIACVFLCMIIVCVCGGVFPQIGRDRPLPPQAGPLRQPDHGEPRPAALRHWDAAHHRLVIRGRAARPHPHPEAA